MLREILDGKYDRNLLIGRPRLSLKDFKCQNITCGKEDQFKKYKEDYYLCECGYMVRGDFEIKETHKVKLYCTSPKNCPDKKTKMDKNCLKCSLIGER
jgi:hypothetical protein